MKIAIMTDMEGVAGVMDFENWAMSHGRYYDKAKELLTMEINAAVDGFCAAGATEITVIDGHGAGGIDPWLLDERAMFSRGWGRPQSFGFGDDFDAISWVGQHAKSGSLHAHLAHTGSHHVLEQKINGVSVGEYGRNAMIAGFYGTPAIFGSGDTAFAKEALELTPWVHTVAVKSGVTLTKGDECTAEEYLRHNLGATHMHPKRARALIREGAEYALRDFIGNREKYLPLKAEPPFVMEIWIRASANEKAHKRTYRHDSDIVGMCEAEAEVSY